MNAVQQSFSSPTRQLRFFFFIYHCCYWHLYHKTSIRYDRHFFFVHANCLENLKNVLCISLLNWSINRNLCKDYWHDTNEKRKCWGSNWNVLPFSLLYSCNIEKSGRCKAPLQKWLSKWYVISCCVFPCGEI